MTSYFNGHIPLYVSDAALQDIQNQIVILNSEINNIISEIADIELAINPDMAQTFKSISSFVPNNLTAGTYVSLTGNDSISVLPGNWTETTGLNYTYTGTSSPFFLITYTVSAQLATLNQAVAFSIFYNDAPQPASAQVLHFNVSEYNAVSGSILKQIREGDTIQLKADLLGSVNDVLNIQNVNLLITKIADQTL
jgi:hypothetical protein